MSLYEHIGPYYDQIFPLDLRAVDAAEGLAPIARPGSALDLGAATGSFSAALAARGWRTLGVELDAAMASSAPPQAQVLQGSMLDAEAIVARAMGAGTRFDLITCLGNTLPHIDSGSLASFFDSLRRLLKPGAPLILQTLNYANPHVRPGFAFPVRETAKFRFERWYEAGPEEGTILFRTRFSASDRLFEDATVLYPHTAETLRALLLRSGFGEVLFCSGWDLKTSNLDGDTYLLSVVR